MLTVAVVLVVAAGVLGDVIGHGRRESAFITGPGIIYATPSGGTAYIGAGEPLNRQPRGFAYLYPSGSVSWIDATGTVHQSSRPACVPYDHAVRVSRMEAVRFPIAGGDMGTVLWVRC